MPRPLFTPGKDPVPIVQEAGWAPGPVWTGAENLTPTGTCLQLERVFIATHQEKFVLYYTFIIRDLGNAQSPFLYFHILLLSGQLSKFHGRLMG